LGLKLGVLKNIGEDIDGSGYICVESLGIVDGVLTLQITLAYVSSFRPIQTYGCVGVKMATHVLDFELQLLLCSVAGTLNPSSVPISTPCESIELYLKGKMFQEVSCAIGLVRLRSRSSINPHPDSRCLRPWRVLRSNLEPVRSLPLSSEAHPYRESVGQSRRFRLHAIFHDRRRKSSLQWGDCIEGSAVAQTLGEVES
jgi:hypothetical protein